MVSKTDAVDDAVDAVTESSLDMDSEAFREMMSDLIQHGMPPAEARYYAADSLSDASYSDLGDVFGVTKGSISSASGDARKTIRNTREAFIRFVDGPKQILKKLSFGRGGFSKTTNHYIVRYTGTPRANRPNADYGVIKLVYEGMFNDEQSFEEFTVDRYESIDTLASEYYEDRLFDDVRDAYAVWTLLRDEGVSEGDMSAPTSRLTHDAESNYVTRHGTLYAFKEETDSLSTMEGWDSLIEYDGEFVDVYMGHSGLNSYSIRAESGAEIDHVEGREQAPNIARLYEEIGPQP